MTAKRLCYGRHGLWELVLWFLWQQASAWMLVSKTGEITFRAPLAIDPSSQNAKVSFRSGPNVWDIYLDEEQALLFRYQENLTYLKLSNETLSVRSMALLGSSLSVVGDSQLDFSLFVFSDAKLGGHLSVTSTVEFGSFLFLRSFA